MKRQRSLVANLLCLAIVVAVVGSVGCSEVIVEPDGSGGRSGSPTGGDGDDDGPTNGSGNQDASSSSGFDPELCGAFCDAVGSCVPTCSANCQGYLLPPCGAQGAALVACLTNHYDVATCDGSACGAEMQALLACRSTTTEECVGGGCGGSETECSCSAKCQGGRRQVLCTNEGGGVAACVCYLNEIPVGECSGEWPADFSDLACGMQKSCCAAVLGPCEGCF